MNVIIVTDGTASEIAELARQVKNGGCTVRETIQIGWSTTCVSPENYARFTRDHALFAICYPWGRPGFDRLNHWLCGQSTDWFKTRQAARMGGRI